MIKLLRGQYMYKATTNKNIDAAATIKTGCPSIKMCNQARQVIQSVASAANVIKNNGENQNVA